MPSRRAPTLPMRMTRVSSPRPFARQLPAYRLSGPTQMSTLGQDGCTTQLPVPQGSRQLLVLVRLLVSVETGFGDPAPLLGGYVDVGG